MLAYRVLLWSQGFHFCFAKNSKTRSYVIKASQNWIPAIAGRIWELTASSGISKNHYSIYLLFCIGYCSEAFEFFYSEWIAIDLTKMHVGGILKKGWRCVWWIHTHGKRLSQGFKVAEGERALTNRKCPNIGLSPLFANSRRQWVKLGRLYFYSLSFL